MSFLSSLPAPKVTGPVAAPASDTNAPSAGPSSAPSSQFKEPPAYGKRKGFVPRSIADFGDGGAFPEIHVPQYPRGMADPARRKQNVDNSLALTVSADGKVNYDALARQGTNQGKIVHSEHAALVPKVEKMSAAYLARPDEEEIARVAAETMKALQAKIDSKSALSNPKTIAPAPGGPQFIKYTPKVQGAQHNSGASARIIQMQELQVDPLEPPKHHVTKVPRPPPDAPVPIMHSPRRNVTAQEMANWKIPPAISNWKNAKGYIIPLDKRLAADGRALQETRINDQFAKLSEALYLVEQKAREDTDLRNRVAREQALREKERKDAEMRELAKQARLEKLGGNPGLAARDTAAVPPPPPPPAMDGDRDRDGERGYARGRGGSTPPPPPPPAFQVEDGERGRGEDREDRDRYRESSEERRERLKREELRKERARERERERRLEAKGEHGFKRSKLTRDRDRDISEKVALGMAKVAAPTGEALYDQRLFNQDAGMQAGFGADEAYNLYDKPLFAERTSNFFRPVKNNDDEMTGEGAGAREEIRTDKFKPDKGFKGAEEAAGPRTGAVQFEAGDEDPFGLGGVFGDSKRK